MINNPDAPQRVELRIAGHLDPRWASWFDGLTITHDDDGTATLRGVVVDQSELHGLLGKVRDIGATLVSVTATAADSGQRCPACPDGAARRPPPR
jgi:hypothetical protein